MKKIILVLWVIFISCGISNEDKAQIKEDIANLNIEIANLNEDNIPYTMQIEDVEAAEQRLSDLQSVLEQIKDSTENSMNRLELESMVEGATHRVEIVKDRLANLQTNYDLNMELINAKLDKINVLEEKLK